MKKRGGGGGRGECLRRDIISPEDSALLVLDRESGLDSRREEKKKLHWTLDEPETDLFTSPERFWD